MKVKRNKRKLNKVRQQTKERLLITLYYVMFICSVQRSSSTSTPTTEENETPKKKLKQTTIKMKFPKPKGSKDGR